MRAVNFGMLLPIPASDVDKLVKIANMAEKSNLDSVWAADHLLMLPRGIVPDVWSMFGAVAVTTSKIKIGSAVSDPHRIHPAVLAQMLATLDRLSSSRIVLGIGAGEAMNVKPFGIPMNKAVDKMIEYVRILRLLWNSDEQNPVTFRGEFWNLTDAFLQVRPKNNKIPIYFGANGKRTMMLTGKYADGWIPMPQTPEIYRRNLQYIKKGAESAGRSFNEIETCLWTYLIISNNDNEVKRSLKLIKPQLVAFPKIVEELNLNLPEWATPNLYSEIDVSELHERRLIELGNYIPDDAALRFCITGRAEDCIKRIEEFIRSGVKHFIFINIGPDPKRNLEILKNKILPVFKN